MWCVIAGMMGSEAAAMGVSAVVAELFFLAATVVMAMISKMRKDSREHDEHKMYKANVAVEQWVNYIIERLWKNNMFLEYAWSDDQYVVGGKIVHIPQPGTQSVVMKNNSSYPQVAVQRTDTDITYNLDTYTTQPTNIPDVDLLQISYDKIASIIEDHYGILIQSVADDIIYKWLNGLPSTSLIQTSGAATAANIGGQSGNRLAMVAEDLQNARLALNKQNVPATGRFAIIQSDLLQQLVSSLSITQYRDFSRAYDEQTGSIGQLYGFHIIERSTTGTVQNALTGGLVTANDFLTAVGPTDNVACLCYHQNAVTRALGERKMYQRLNDPLYYGDIYSMLLRMGGMRRRADNNGIVAIVQTAD